MKIKKIILATGASLGVTGGLIIPIMNQASHIQQKNEINDTKASYKFEIARGTSDRITTITLSNQDTQDYWNAIKQYKNDASKGESQSFYWLTAADSWNDHQRWEFGDKLNDGFVTHDDLNSFRALFQQTNKHTQWGFNFNLFYKKLELKAAQHLYMRMKFYVKYEFLAHDLYDIDFSIN